MLRVVADDFAADRIAHDYITFRMSQDVSREAVFDYSTLIDFDT